MPGERYLKFYLVVLTLMFFLSICSLAGAQPQLLWQKTFSDLEEFTCIVRSGDGGFIAAGMGPSFNVLKIDRDGNKVWNKTLLIKGSAFSIVQSGDGGFIIAGRTCSSSSSKDEVYLLKIDAEGNKIWDRTYGNPGNDFARDIIECGDGTFVVVGQAESAFGIKDISIVRIDGSGSTLWNKTYSCLNNEIATCVARTHDGGYIAAGYTDSYGAGAEDVYILKVDGQGNKLWGNPYGGSSYDEACAIVEAGDGGFVVTGFTKSFGAAGYDVYLLKIDRDGEKIWEKTYGGGYDDWGRAIVRSGEGFMIAGYTTTGFYSDLYLLKVDSAGEKVWDKAYDSGGGEDAFDIARAGDLEFVMAGCRYSSEMWKAYLLKIKDPSATSVPEVLPYLLALLLLPFLIGRNQIVKGRVQSGMI